MPEPATTRRPILLTLGFMLLWGGGVTWAAPWVIRGAHSGAIPVLGRLIPGRATQPVAGYLEAWAPVARASIVLVWTAAVLVLAAVLIRRHARARQAAPDRPDPAPLAAQQFLLVAAWAGLITGLGEAWYQVGRVFYRGLELPNVFGISQHAVWMAPLANLVALTLLGLLLLAVWSRLPGRFPPGVWVGALAATGLFSWTMATGRVHWAAAAVLCLGVTAQLVRALSPGAGEVAALARSTMPWLLALVAGMGAIVPVLESRQERRQVAEASGAQPAADAPNILFLMLDTERAASTSLHGAARPTTPFLEELARRGVWFDRAITPNSWTLPTHAAMFTGRHTNTLGVGWAIPLDDTYPVIAEVLTARGYATAGFVANTKYLSDLFGLGRGFGVWKDQPIVPGTVVIHSWLARSVVGPVRHWFGNHQMLRRKTADGVNEEFLAWLDRREARPFFAFLNYFDAHEPYLPPEPWNLRFSETQPLYWSEPDKKNEDYTAAEIAELATAYESSIAYLDNRLELLFDALEERDLLRNTLVIVTSDHGEAMGENGQLTHGFDMTLPTTHVPLVLVYPGVLPAGRKVTTPVEVRHLAATILGFAGGPDPAIPGASLEQYWTAPPDSTISGATYSTDGLFASIVTDSMQFVKHREGAERLFNHRTDPLGLRNLRDDPAYREVAEALHEQLRAWMATQR